MNKKEFIFFRKKLAKTQKELAALLGRSLKAVHSYEQGWRSVTPDVERQLFFLLCLKMEQEKRRRPCWRIKNCPTERRRKCPAWEMKAGNLCLFVNGNICNGAVQKDWQEKMKLCRQCRVLQPLLSPEMEIQAGT